MGRRGSLALVAVALGVGAVVALLVLRGRDHEVGAASQAPAAPEVESARGSGPVLQGLSEEALKASRGRAAERWREGLAAEDAAARLATVNAWEKSGLALEEIAKELVPLLADWKPEVRRAARAAFLGLGAHGVDVLLREGLGSPDWEVPALAIEVLGEVAASGSARIAVDRLLEILGNPALNRAWRERAATALGRVRPVEQRVRDALVRATRDTNDEIAASAVEGLGLLRGEGEQHLPMLLAMLSDPETRVARGEVLRALGTIARQPDVVIPAIFRWCEKSGYEPQTAFTVAAFGETCFPHLVAALRGEAAARQGLALNVIETLGPARCASLAGDVLAMAQRDPEADWALYTIQRMGPAAEGVVPSVALLVSPDEGVRDRRTVMMALAGLGPKGQDVLLGLLGSTDAGIRADAASTIGNCPNLTVESKRLLQALADGDPDERVRRNAKWTIDWLAGKRP